MKFENLNIKSDYNILDFYESVLKGKLVKLKKGTFNYKIDRKSEQWNNDLEWVKKVVWFANKKGAYLYGSKALKKYYSAHY